MIHIRQIYRLVTYSLTRTPSCKCFLIFSTTHSQKKARRNRPRRVGTMDASRTPLWQAPRKKWRHCARYAMALPTPTCLRVTGGPIDGVRGGLDLFIREYRNDRDRAARARQSVRPPGRDDVGQTTSSSTDSPAAKVRPGCYVKRHTQHDFALGYRSARTHRVCLAAYGQSRAWLGWSVAPVHPLRGR